MAVQALPRSRARSDPVGGPVERAAIDAFKAVAHREERAAIERFASAQDRCAADVAELARRLTPVQGPGFRRTLGRLIVAL